MPKSGKPHTSCYPGKLVRIVMRRTGERYFERYLRQESGSRYVITARADGGERRILAADIKSFSIIKGGLSNVAGHGGA